MRFPWQRDAPKPPRLTIELVPRTCWYSNVRSEVSPAVWDAIRKPVYRAARWTCEICGTKPNRPVEAHEVWQYDDVTHVQRLVRMIALCPDCHGVKHIGHSAHEGRAEQAERHLRRVNGWNRQQTDEYIENAFTLWAVRSTHDWTLDLSILRFYGVTPPVAPTRQQRQVSAAG